MKCDMHVLEDTDMKKSPYVLENGNPVEMYQIQCIDERRTRTFHSKKTIPNCWGIWASTDYWVKLTPEGRAKCDEMNFRYDLWNPTYNDIPLLQLYRVKTDEIFGPKNDDGWQLVKVPVRMQLKKSSACESITPKQAFDDWCIGDVMDAVKASQAYFWSVVDIESITGDNFYTGQVECWLELHEDNRNYKEYIKTMSDYFMLNNDPKVIESIFEKYSTDRLM